MDGTLYRGSEPLPYAAEWIARLNLTGVKYLLCTNCPMHSPDTLVSRLHSMGIETTPEHILTSGMALKSIYPSGGEITLLGSPMYQHWLEQNGFEIAEKASVAVVGYNPGMRYEDLKRICFAIQSGAAFILTNEDDVIPEGKTMVPHTGAIGAAVSFATGAVPTVLGKPHRPMMEAALKILGCRAEDTTVFGDRMDMDIGFANKYGAGSALLLTGITTAEMVSISSVKPTWVFESLLDVIRWEEESDEE